jgi:exopolyphosphatase / guanosine-5'-triphosphate,3'-diphosphate pyrophosphatase
MTAIARAPRFGPMRFEDSHFAAIDVGTNATRLKIAARRSDGRLDTLFQQRDPIRPGEGVFSGGVMPERVVDRLVYTLAEYAAEVERHRARPRGVATSALRVATNREQVLKRVLRETGLALEVITGEEEARLLCLGVLAGAAAWRESLCLDVGGGSTEVVLARGEVPEAVFSLELGSARLGERAPGDDVVRMRAIADEVVAVLPAELGASAAGEALACSGSLRALVAFASGEPSATREQLARATERLVALGPDGRRGEFDPRRAEVMLAAAVIAEALVARLGLDSLRAVKRGLRDGVLVELSRRAPAAVRELRAAWR